MRTRRGTLQQREMNGKDLYSTTESILTLYSQISKASTCLLRPFQVYNKTDLLPAGFRLSRQAAKTEQLLYFWELLGTHRIEIVFPAPKTVHQATKAGWMGEGRLMRLQIRTGSTPGWMIGSQPCRGATLGGPAERGGCECLYRKLQLIQLCPRL
jgi:hypothetical protein